MMEHHIQEIGSWEELRGKGSLCMQRERYMREIGFTIKLMGKEFILTQTKLNM